MLRLVTRPSPAVPELTLSADEARLMTLRAQGFIGTEVRRGGVPAMLRRLGAVQLDTISVLARSHELVAYARLGPVPRARVERAYWHPGKPDAFEYWSHAACVLPIEEWPFYGFRRRTFRARGRHWHKVPENACTDVLARLSAEGPLTATQLGGAKRGSDWWDWSDMKIAVEWLLTTGAVICTRRTGWRRVYDLPERVLPGHLLDAEPSDEQCITHLVAIAARALGVVTRSDLVDYQRLRNFGAAKALDGFSVDAAAASAGLIPVLIAAGVAKAGQAANEAGSGAASSRPRGLASASGTATAPVQAWADPAALAGVGGTGQDAAGRGRHRVTLLSPFDSLIWDRKRTLRMFGFEHSLEAYLPSAKRVHGYFTMPLLAGGRLVGRVDPARSGRTLLARKLSLQSAAAAPAMARALRDAAAWVGCDNVSVGEVAPARLEGRMRAEITAVT
jgi:uncharacterized protein YcaQ